MSQCFFYSSFIPGAVGLPRAACRWGGRFCLTDPAVCRFLSLLFFPHTSLSQLLCSYFCPSLNVTTEMPPASLLGSSLANGGSFLELAGTDCTWHRAAPGLFSQKMSQQPPIVKHPPTDIQHKHMNKFWYASATHMRAYSSLL